MLSPQGVKLRSDFFQGVRSFFLDHGYLEVDTPVRLPAILPEAEIVPFPSKCWWLQTSPELCMKRLLTRGVQQLFQICHCFRQHEMGRYHETEFTLLEWYHVGWDYLDLMAECERFIQFLATHCASFPGMGSPATLQRKEQEVSLRSPWIRMTVDEAFRAFAGLSAVEALEADRFEEVLVSEVEPHLGWHCPVFLYDYPVKLGSLARKKQSNPQLAERFELYLCGLELANGFSELVEPMEQRHRFINECEKIQAAGRSAKVPEKFLQDLSLLEDTAGIALGLDRLFMLFTGVTTIAEAMPFARKDL